MYLNVSSVPLVRPEALVHTDSMFFFPWALRIDASPLSNGNIHMPRNFWIYKTSATLLPYQSRHGIDILDAEDR